MRWPILISLVLAGCVAYADGDYKPVTTPAEIAEYNSLLPRIDKVTKKLLYTGASLCAAPKDQRCHLFVGMMAAPGIGAYSTTKYVMLSMPTVHYLKTDAELALVIAHEWGHRLLGHTEGESIGGSFEHRELSADCVGALLVKRAGYDPIEAADSYRRLANADLGENILLAAVGIFGAGAKLDWNRRRDVILAAAKAAVSFGTNVPKEAINQICGVELP